MQPNRLLLPSLLLSIAGACQSVGRGAPPELSSASAPQLAGTRHLTGLLDLRVDDETGRAWLRLPAPGEGGQALTCLYAEGLTSGLGSNPVGLDRGQLGPARVVAFRVVGERVLVEALNQRFRAVTADEQERRATRESFATSILWSERVAERRGDGSILVDFTSFLVRDAHGLARTLAGAGQGAWTLDRDRSTFDPKASLAFADNVELEAILTLSGEGPGSHVMATAPDPHSLTFIQHHSFIRLPDAGFEPRPHDPRTGANSIAYLDYAVPLDEAVERRLAIRHRLQRVEPGNPSSPVLEPIVYYVDRAAPEPIRSALLEGAGWWSEAFAAAGFPDGFRVELLPEGVHPLDARYNVIEWVHRSTRGWSYGGGIVDPRTGEMIKGHVSLGSLRVRQDRRLFEGLLGTGATGSGAVDDPIELALARIRQLSAHEVGHTLGLQHNFAASTYDGRASVMDYPAPMVRVTGGELDVSDAYGVGAGTWDLHTIRCLYEECPDGEGELEFIDRLVREGRERGQLFLSDSDARPGGAAHPLANLWDNGSDPLAELERSLEVRRIALDRFGARNLLPGQPLAELQEVLVPIYFYHRYQLQAAFKTVGGFDYRHSVVGDGRGEMLPIGAERQRSAIRAILSILDPAMLDLPEEVLRQLPPRSPERSRNREMFASQTEPGIDALGIARTAARAVIAGLLQPQRLNRIVDHQRRMDGGLTLEELVDALVDATFGQANSTVARVAEIQDVVRETLIDEWIRVLMNPELGDHVRGRLEGLLVERAVAMAEGAQEGSRESRTVARIERFLSRPWSEGEGLPPAPEMPPGSPIGGRGSMGACGMGPEW